MRRKKMPQWREKLDINPCKNQWIRGEGCEINDSEFKRRNLQIDIQLCRLHTREVAMSLLAIVRMFAGHLATAEYATVSTRIDAVNTLGRPLLSVFVVAAAMVIVRRLIFAEIICIRVIRGYLLATVDTQGV